MRMALRGKMGVFSEEKGLVAKRGSAQNSGAPENFVRSYPTASPKASANHGDQAVNFGILDPSPWAIHFFSSFVLKFTGGGVGGVPDPPSPPYLTQQ